MTNLAEKRHQKERNNMSWDYLDRSLLIRYVVSFLAPRGKPVSYRKLCVYMYLLQSLKEIGLPIGYKFKLNPLAGVYCDGLYSDLVYMEEVGGTVKLTRESGVIGTVALPDDRAGLEQKFQELEGKYYGLQGRLEIIRATLQKANDRKEARLK